MLDFEKLAEFMLQTVKGYVDRKLQSFAEKQEAIEYAIKNLPAPQTVDVNDIVKTITESLPVPKDGVDGKNAEPVDVAAIVAEVRSAIPTPENGKDAVSPTPEEVAKALLPMMRQPEDGKSVTVEDFMPLFEKAVAEWALHFERRAQDLLQKAIDNIPKPKDGTDGLGFDELDVAPNGERGIVLRFAQGDRVKEFPITFPTVIYRDVFRDDQAYQKHDAVTWAGSLWIAQKDAPTSKPGDGEDWRLAVKKGRDGKAGRNGIDKTAPVKLS